MIGFMFYLQAFELECPHRSDPGSAQLPAFFNHVNNLKNSFIIVHIATKTLNLMAVRAGVGRIKSITYADGLTILSILFLIRLMKKPYLDSPHPNPPHQEREPDSIAICCFS
ncbi:hypothetical protein [Methylovulum psychrotolerans]|uniref:hypothetical protein n=1 Tax=Methylovulum psychrotolerans TaxID=1704499 RepID=UPI0012FA0C3E|nr:hypothetical protein [Methylovulum psychrotolerans]